MTDTVAACCANLYELPLTRLLLGDSFHPGGVELTQELARMALASRESVVLDLASGLGTSAAALTRNVGCSVIGLDYSQANAAKAAHAAGHRCRFLAGSAGDLPFPARCFDIVMSECALCTFSDQPRALAEATRILKPRGRVAISDMTIETEIPKELDNLISHVLCIAGAHPVERYRSLLDEAGFLAIRTRDRRSALLAMVDRIDRNLHKVERLAGAGEIELPADFEDAAPTLRAARDFIVDGGVSYTLITARRPE